MIKALRWSVGTPAPEASELPAEHEKAQEAPMAMIRELSSARAACAARQSVTVEDALREMENAMSVQRELRASAQRLLTKLANT